MAAAETMDARVEAAFAAAKREVLSEIRTVAERIAAFRDEAVPAIDRGDGLAEQAGVPGVRL